jgi:TatD DNase family protein
MLEFTDTHAHLDFPEFAPDLSELVARATAAGVTRIISIGCDLESSARAVALAERFPEVYAAVGWHPCYVEEAPADFRCELRALAQHPKVVAIGECGLDHYRLPSKETGTHKTAADDEAYKTKQVATFQQQLEVAAELGLNCIVHERAAFEPVLAMVRPFAGRVRTVFHCFVGAPEQMQSVIETGGSVSFTGIATFKNAELVRASLQAVPADRFLLETDAPYLAPVPHRGRRCEPAFVADLARCVSGVRGVSLSDLSLQVQANTQKFFPRLR